MHLWDTPCMTGVDPKPTEERLSPVTAKFHPNYFNGLSISYTEESPSIFRSIKNRVCSSSLIVT